MKIYLVRHAEAMGNVNSIFQGHTDCDLSDKGRMQLDLLKERFKDIHLDALYSSPLIRTLKTSDAVNYYHNLPVVKVRDLMEINGGVFEGEKWEDIPVIYPEEFSLWKDRHHEFHVKDGESMIQVYDRMKKAMLDIVKENPDKTVAVVSHGCAIRNFLCYANGIDFSGISETAWCDNTSVSLIEFDEKCNPTVVFQNDSSHLDFETSTIIHQSWWKR